MKVMIIAVILLTGLPITLSAQAVFVNPDGSHSVAFINESGVKPKTRLDDSDFNHSESYYKNLLRFRFKRKLRKFKKAQHRLNDQKQTIKRADQ